MCFAILSVIPEEEQISGVERPLLPPLFCGCSQFSEGKPCNWPEPVSSERFKSLISNLLIARRSEEEHLLDAMIYEQFQCSFIDSPILHVLIEDLGKVSFKLGDYAGIIKGMGVEAKKKSRRRVNDDSENTPQLAAAYRWHMSQVSNGEDLEVNPESKSCSYFPQLNGTNIGAGIPSVAAAGFRETHESLRPIKIEPGYEVSHPGSLNQGYDIGYASASRESFSPIGYPGAVIAENGRVSGSDLLTNGSDPLSKGYGGGAVENPSISNSKDPGAGNEATYNRNTSKHYGPNVEQYFSQGYYQNHEGLSPRGHQESQPAGLPTQSPICQQAYPQGQQIFYPNLPNGALQGSQAGQPSNEPGQCANTFFGGQPVAFPAVSVEHQPILRRLNAPQVISADCDIAMPQPLRNPYFGTGLVGLDLPTQSNNSLAPGLVDEFGRPCFQPPINLKLPVESTDASLGLTACPTANNPFAILTAPEITCNDDFTSTGDTPLFGSAVNVRAVSSFSEALVLNSSPTPTGFDSRAVEADDIDNLFGSIPYSHNETGSNGFDTSAFGTGSLEIDAANDRPMVNVDMVQSEDDISAANTVNQQTQYSKRCRNLGLNVNTTHDHSVVDMGLAQPEDRVFSDLAPHRTTEPTSAASNNFGFVLSGNADAMMVDAEASQPENDVPSNITVYYPIEAFRPAGNLGLATDADTDQSTVSIERSVPEDDVFAAHSIDRTAQYYGRDLEFNPDIFSNTDWTPVHCGGVLIMVPSDGHHKIPKANHALSWPSYHRVEQVGDDENPQHFVIFEDYDDRFNEEAEANDGLEDDHRDDVDWETETLPGQEMNDVASGVELSFEDERELFKKSALLFSATYNYEQNMRRARSGGKDEEAEDEDFFVDDYDKEWEEEEDEEEHESGYIESVESDEGGKNEYEGDDKDVAVEEQDEIMESIEFDDDDGLIEHRSEDVIEY